MHSVVKGKFWLGSGIADGPAGKTTSDFDHILLCVAAVDAQSMQFHQFAPIILVEPTFSYGWQLGICAASKLFRMAFQPLGGLGISAEVIVQVKQHRWN